MNNYMKSATRTRKVRKALQTARIPSRKIYTLESGATWVIPHYGMEIQTAKALTDAGYTVEHYKSEGSIPTAVLVPAENFPYAK